MPAPTSRRATATPPCYDAGCDIPGCDGKHHARGLCGAHIHRERRYGDPLAPHLARAFTEREDQHLMELETHPTGRVIAGQYAELSVMFGRSVRVLKSRRYYKMGRLKHHPGPQARRKAAEAEQDEPAG